MGKKIKVKCYAAANKYDKCICSSLSKGIIKFDKK